MENNREATEVALANDISNFLCWHYRGHRWAVNVDTNGGIIKIIEADMMDVTTPYVLRLNEVAYSQKKLQRAVIRAGGEILERFRMSRNGQKVDTVQDLIAEAPKDIRGNVLFDARGIPNWIGEKAGESVR